jgi:hypothetical protein
MKHWILTGLLALAVFTQGCAYRANYYRQGYRSNGRYQRGNDRDYRHDGRYADRDRDYRYDRRR